MKRFRLTEKESAYPEYNYCEDFNSYEEAFSRMRELYHYNAGEANSEAIEKAEINKRSAYVLVKDGYEIEWDIEEL